LIGRRRRHSRCSGRQAIPLRKEGSMLDLILIATTFVFFGAAWAYAHACERL
jgi:hypothetical protein